VDEVNRRTLAVERMTCPPKAFRTGQSLVPLEPGASCLGEWGITPKPRLRGTS
jgi:aldose 1-epimerase